MFEFEIHKITRFKYEWLKVYTSMRNTPLFEAFKEFVNKKKLSLNQANGNGCYVMDDIGVRVMYYQNSVEDQNSVEELEIVGNEHSYIFKREKEGIYGLYTPPVFYDNNNNDYKLYTFYPNELNNTNNKSILAGMISDYYSRCRGELEIIKEEKEEVEKNPSLETCIGII